MIAAEVVVTITCERDGYTARIEPKTGPTASGAPCRTPLDAMVSLAQTVYAGWEMSDKQVADLGKGSG